MLILITIFRVLILHILYIFEHEDPPPPVINLPLWTPALTKTHLKGVRVSFDRGYRDKQKKMGFYNRNLFVDQISAYLALCRCT